MEPIQVILTIATTTVLIITQMIPWDNKNLALLQLFIQTTDEDPNINEDDKQVNIDEASTQESGNVV